MGEAVAETMNESDWIQMLKALADQTRLRIVKELLAGTFCVNDLAERLNVSQYNVSKHLRVLRETGIVEMEKQGTRHECRLALPFRERMDSNGDVLDLGCCTFRFAELR